MKGLPVKLMQMGIAKFFHWNFKGYSTSINTLKLITSVTWKTYKPL